MSNAVCRDCDCPADAQSGHYYTLREDLWRSIADADDFLCLDCCEKRLGRPLTEDMFVALPFEIIARFAGETVKPEGAVERQRQLNSWRAFIREHALW